LRSLLLWVHTRSVLSVVRTARVTLSLALVLHVVGLLELGLQTASTVLILLFTAGVLILDCTGVGIAVGVVTTTSGHDPGTLRVSTVEVAYHTSKVSSQVDID